MRLYSFVIFQILPLLLLAQTDIKFERYSSDNGLPMNYVYEIHQDSEGFIWFGLRGAVCRYDGFTFKSFPVKMPDQEIPLSMSVTNIVTDKNNRLWIGGFGQFGLLMFDNKNEVFIDCFGKLNLPTNIKKINVNTLICDSNGELWIGAGIYGIIRFNPETGETRHIFHEPENQNTIPSGTCTSIMEEKNGDIWFGIDGQICRYTRNSGVFSNFNILKGSSIKQIKEDSKNNIWSVVVSSGLHIFDRKSDTFIKFNRNEDLNRIPVILNIFEDDQNNFWIGTNQGLFKLNEHYQTLMQYKYDETDPESINSNRIKAITQDNTENLWIGTSEGAAMIKKQFFKTYSYSSKKNSISQNKVHCIFEKSVNDILIATPEGIDNFNRETGQFTVWARVTRKNRTELLAPPLAIGPSGNNGLWIGTYFGGLHYFDYNTNHFSYYLADLNNNEALSSNSIFSLILDKNELLWIGTWEGGINVFDKNVGKYKHFRHIKNDSSSLLSDHIQNIYKDSKDRIWIGMIGGAAVVEDYIKGKFSTILDSSTFNTNTEIIAYHFSDARDGDYIWIASNIGLLRYHVVNNRIIRFTKKNGLPSSHIMGILNDNENNLWVSTSNGLVLIEPTYNNEVNLICKTYKKSDGLQGNEFLPASCCKLHDGTLVWGGEKGFSMFQPNNIKHDTIPPALAFTELKIANQLIHVGESINGQIILDKSLNQKKQIILNHQNNKFSIGFVALHFNQALNNQYAYKLQNYDTKWNYTNAFNRKAIFMNLNGGEYILHVKASNCDGVWNEKGISLKIKILPPWWKTWWFILFWGLFMATSIIVVVKIRLYKVNKQKEKLENIVNLRTNELQKANLELEEKKEELEQQMLQMKKMNVEIEHMAKKLHDADQMKLRFFANISHEFRTPLSLIIGPIERCMNIEAPVDWNIIKNRYLSLVSKNSKRLLRLVNQIIDFRKIDQGQKTINRTNNNIVQFINEIVDIFMVMAESKQIQLGVKSEELRVKSGKLGVNRKKQSSQNSSSSLITHHSSLITQFWFDPDIMEKILFNLLSNAIKYTPEGGEIFIQFRVKNEELRVEKKKNQSNNLALITHHSSLFIKIIDTGIGIKPENIDKIFDRFYRVDSDNRFKKEGSGIGLAYTKELVELHNGEIHVKSTPGKGSSFTLSFPINDNHSNELNYTANNIHELAFTKSMISNKTDGKTFHLSQNNNNVVHSHDKQSNGESHSRSTILIVEDNKDLRNFMKNELEQQYLILEAENGEVGLRTAIEKNPALIISDIMMPVMDGFQLCKKIKANKETSHIPVILLTAKGGEENILEGLHTGANDYITKPFNIDILILKMNNLLDLRKQLQEKFKGSLELIPQEIKYSSVDEQFIEKATKIVCDNINNAEFDNNHFAQLMDSSRSVVYKKIKNISGQSVSEFIRTIRLKKAAHLFIEGNQNISQVCYQVGFKHPSVFTRYFTKMFSMPPTQFIEENMNN